LAIDWVSQCVLSFKWGRWEVSKWGGKRFTAYLKGGKELGLWTGPDGAVSITLLQIWRERFNSKNVL
jgi:hypothetical protein